MWLMLFAGMALPDRPVHAQATNTAVEPDHAARRAKGLEVFRTQVRSVLKQKCVLCHGGESTEAKLDLTTQEGLLKGGERGPAIVIGRGDKSLLTRLITHQQEPHMPKDEPKLSDQQIAAVIHWIDLGAPYDEPLVKVNHDTASWINRRISTDAKRHWAYRSLQSVSPPQPQDHRHWVGSPIDQFVLARLISHQLHPNGPVGKSATIRRLYFDLIGLPPSADEVDDFVTDNRPDAYERLVDRLLASPHYGERWARRWLDLARFAESHGFEHDYDRATAFHYRDFVVYALNSAMPYDQFVRWQIAGDELAPNDRWAMMATGYLAAGVHSTQITKKEVEKHRYDEMDDILSTIGTSFLGLTIGCARCHDHKFDAIPQADYYRLLSTFTKTVRSEVELDFDPAWYQRAKLEFDQQHLPYESALRDYEDQHLPLRFAEWWSKRDPQQDSPWLIPEEISFKSQGAAVFTRQPDESWLVSGPNAANDSWVIEFATKRTGIKSIRLETLADPSLKQSGPGRAPNGNFALSDFQVSIRPMTDQATVSPTPVPLVSAAATFEQKGLPVAAAIDSDPGSAWAVDPEFGKNHSAVFTAGQAFGYEQGTRVTITLKFNNNVHHGIGRPRLSISSEANLPATVGGAGREEIREILAIRFEKLNADQKWKILDWFKPQDAGWKSIDDRRVAHAATAPRPRIQKVLVASEGLPPVTLHTQAEAEFLKETHFLRRGEPNNKEAVATQSFLQVLLTDPDTAQIFQTPPPDGSRTTYLRTALTNWLIDPESGAGSLLARVMVNRLWQHHLGRGIVATPSDFGVRGEAPTHPELLEWLASEFVRRQWELKPLHRQILCSNTYRQSCETDEARLTIDRENRLLWHRPRRRLEAEVIRDALLEISGQLNDRLYGPGQLDEGHRRRSLYFTVKRSQLMPSMTVFDAPDGTSAVAERPQTTIAPQALLLMNNANVREASRQFALRLLPESGKSPETAVRCGYLTALSRAPTEQELVESVRFLSQQTVSYQTTDPQNAVFRSLVDFCQVLFCLNEFLYTD